MVIKIYVKDVGKIEKIMSQFRQKNAKNAKLI